MSTNLLILFQFLNKHKISKISSQRLHLKIHIPWRIFNLKYKTAIKRSKMDSMSPPTMWVKGRCYRVTSEEGVDVNKLKNARQPQHAPYREEDNDEDDCQEYNVEQTPSGAFKMAFHVPTTFFAILIGTKGTTKKRIEGETKTQIKVPRPGIDEDIVIKGSYKEDVIRARTRIDLIVLSARKKHQPTHFVGVPMITPSMKEAFIKFRDTMLNDPETKHVDENLYQNPDKLHITIVLLALMDNVDRELASETLQECKEPIINSILSQNNGKLELVVRGLECMNDDPSCVNVLFAKVESQALVQLADTVADRFGKIGLMVRYNGPIKVHMTVINSKFGAHRNEEKQDKKSSTFDATKILSKYGDYDFGTVTVSEIHLSQRFTYASNGFYEATAILKFD